MVCVISLICFLPSKEKENVWKKKERRERSDNDGLEERNIKEKIGRIDSGQADILRPISTQRKSSPPLPTKRQMEVIRTWPTYATSSVSCTRCSDITNYYSCWSSVSARYIRPQQPRTKNPTDVGRELDAFHERVKKSGQETKSLGRLFVHCLVENAMQSWRDH
jgi:hypothetical protein